MHSSEKFVTVIEYTPIVVAFKKKTGTKVWIKTFTNLRTPDPLITNRSKLLPEGSEIVDLGVGSYFEEKYRKKYQK